MCKACTCTRTFKLCYKACRAPDWIPFCNNLHFAMLPPYVGLNVASQGYILGLLDTMAGRFAEVTGVRLQVPS